MKTVLVGVGVAVLALGLYLGASPYFALGGLRSAIQEGDAASLEDRVDFPALRESLKAEFNAKLLAESSEGLADNPFGPLALGIASKFVDGIVDAAVTPSGLAQMAKGEAQPIADPDTEPTPEITEREQRQKVFANARVERDTLSRFSVWVPDEEGGDVRFVFRRRGLSWILTGIELPDSAETEIETEGL